MLSGSESGSDDDEPEPKNEFNVPTSDEDERGITVKLVEDIADDPETDDESGDESDLDTSEPQFGSAYGSDEINQAPVDESTRYRYFNLPIPRLYTYNLNSVSTWQRLPRGKENVPPLDDLLFDDNFTIDGDDELTSFLTVDELVSNFGPNNDDPSTSMDLDIQNAIAASLPIANFGNSTDKDDDEDDVSSGIGSPDDFEGELTITYSNLNQSTIRVPLTSDNSRSVDTLHTATFTAANHGNESPYTTAVSSETTESNPVSTPTSFVTANEPSSNHTGTAEMNNGNSNVSSASPIIPEKLQHSTPVSNHMKQQPQLNTTGFGFSKLQLEPFLSHHQIPSKVTTSIDTDLQRIETTFECLVDSVASSPVPRMNLSMFGELVKATIKIVSSSLTQFLSGDAENGHNWGSLDDGLGILVSMIKTVTLEEIDQCFKKMFGFDKDEENITVQSERCHYQSQPEQQELVPSSPITKPGQIDSTISSEYNFPTLAERLEQQANQIKLQIRQKRADAWVKLKFLKIIISSRSMLLTELNTNYGDESEDDEVVDKVNETILKSLYRKIERWLIDLVKHNPLDFDDNTIANEEDRLIQFTLDEFLEVWDPIRLKMVKMFDGYVKIDGNSDQVVHLVDDDDETSANQN
ncbi:unnamed protein product [Ambrosiozyma monospora]|uniref:Unnamed protein product n=1 Tax=Ambrosiozyma monospora TaxID=43982 RepID=A0ACB5T7G7_AMBMO|nr:unnamed protein product [Ambrosiozyma monospora]